MRIPVILVFDIGKTNKKALLFDESYRLVYEDSRTLPQGQDEEGFPCEDLPRLRKWIQTAYARLIHLPQFEIKAINISAYGASFVYLDFRGKPTLRLYNYLKPYPVSLQRKFFATYGRPDLLAKQTASPVLGNLNSGMQLYRIKYQNPKGFERIRWALHLPQFISWLLTSSIHNDITGIGCHTFLWDFKTSDYHSWVKAEEFVRLFPAVLSSRSIAGSTQEKIPVGGGLHDSSAALIPYLASFHEPFLLLSTGTWCISLNPFNRAPLTPGELRKDCLCYLSYEGRPLKAARLFAGYEHEQQTIRLATHFKKRGDYYKSISFNPQVKLLPEYKFAGKKSGRNAKTSLVTSGFRKRRIGSFISYEQAYHQLIADIMVQQVRNTNLVLKRSPVKRIFVDGGFSNNSIYMHLLARAFPTIEIFAASLPQASAMGAALAIHEHWNRNPLPSDIIELKYYGPATKRSRRPS